MQPAVAAVAMTNGDVVAAVPQPASSSPPGTGYGLRARTPTEPNFSRPLLRRSLSTAPATRAAMADQQDAAELGSAPPPPPPPPASAAVEANEAAAAEHTVPASEEEVTTDGEDDRTECPSPGSSAEDATETASSFAFPEVVADKDVTRPATPTTVPTTTARKGGSPTSDTSPSRAAMSPPATPTTLVDAVSVLTETVYSPSTPRFPPKKEDGDSTPTTPTFEAEEGDEEEAATPMRLSHWRRRWRLYTAGVVFALVVLGAVAAVLVIKLRQSSSSGNDDTSGPQVTLSYATYAGTQEPNGVTRYSGLRYAAPPVGDLRWRAPQPPNATEGVQDATQFGNICLATNGGGPVAGWDEDCLFANVWTPSNATSTSKLPVWVFIQGGGYTANTNANWNGSGVVEASGHSIVMVDFNYRVGLWGFLASETVRQDGALNAGLLDQRQLLAWVQQEIAQFGGDPAHVVIHGASAGAGSVVLHMTAYGGRDDGLFAGAVAESVFFPAQPYVDQLEWQFDRLVGAAGCNTSAAEGGSDIMACLRSQDASALQAANVAQPFPGRSGPPMPLFYWTPCVDGDLIADLPYSMLAQGRFLRVPLVFGDDTDEGSTFVPNAATEDDLTTFMQDNYPLLTANDTAAILDHYPVLPSDAAGRGAYFPALSRAYGEATFTCPAMTLLSIFAAGSGGSDAWSYRYDVQDSGNAAAGLGVPHLFEASAVFGPGNAGPAAASYYSYNAAIVPVVMAYWISFVRSLDPNPFRAAGAPEWASWASGVSGSGNGTDGAAAGGARIVLATGNVTMEVAPADQMARCAFWQSLVDVTQQKR